MREPNDCLIRNTRRSSAIPGAVRLFCFLGCLALAISTARATTVIPPTFDQLVSDAEVIFEGTVTTLRSEWAGQGPQRHIVSYITFRVEDPIKAGSGSEYTIRMFGGTIDGHTIEVADAPRFKVGDRDILFVEHNGTQFIPLVGIMHGRFHVLTDETGARETIAKDNGSPLADLSKLGKDEPSAGSGHALSKTEFKAAIRQKLAEQAAR